MKNIYSISFKVREWPKNNPTILRNLSKIQRPLVYFLFPPAHHHKRTHPLHTNNHSIKTWYKLAIITQKRRSSKLLAITKSSKKWLFFYRLFLWTNIFRISNIFKIFIAMFSSSPFVSFWLNFYRELSHHKP